MSIALLVRDNGDAQQRLVPVTTQGAFVARWLPAAAEVRASWIELAETGFDVTAENCMAVIAELERLRTRMAEHEAAGEIERLDRLVAELRALRFEAGATAFLG